jgi:hypothetical protein
MDEISLSERDECGYLLSAFLLSKKSRAIKGSVRVLSSVIPNLKFSHLFSICCLPPSPPPPQSPKERKKNAPLHVPAPKMALPGHAESYNPPEEYLPDEEEMKQWCVMHGLLFVWVDAVLRLLSLVSSQVEYHKTMGVVFSASYCIEVKTLASLSCLAFNSTHVLGFLCF